jgi:hypothetical protein
MRDEAKAAVRGQIALGKSEREIMAWLAEKGMAEPDSAEAIQTLMRERRSGKTGAGLGLLLGGGALTVIGAALWGFSTTKSYGGYSQTTSYYPWGLVIMGAILAILGIVKLVESRR